jgi:hypothetical protein
MDDWFDHHLVWAVIDFVIWTRDIPQTSIKHAMRRWQK